MKLLQSCNPWHPTRISRVFKVLFFSSISPTSSPSGVSLRHRILPAGDPKISVVPVLDQWIEEGRSVRRQEIQSIIIHLRKCRRFTHALEISEWANKRWCIHQSPKDVATWLDLISKVHGLERAEKCFSSIPDSLKVLQVYGAFLNCYAHHKSLEKAEGIMQKMRELGFLTTPLSYNVMLNLYSQMGKYEELDIIAKEMKEKGINFDEFTYCIQLNACVATSDIEGMEKLLIMMEADPLVTVDWNAYIAAANGYLKAGLTEKTLAVVKKAEKLIIGKSKKFVYEILITLYTAMGNKDEVYRIWNLYKNIGRSFNTGYLCMLSSLTKLDDIDGVEKILEEWESVNTCFDLRIPNLLVRFYCKEGLLEKAEALVSRLIENGKEPNANTWDCMATGYHRDNQMTKAVEMMKKAIQVLRPGWKLNRDTFAACVDFLKGKGDVEVAEVFIKLLKEQDHLEKNTCNKLVNYIHDGTGSIASNGREQ